MHPFIFVLIAVCLLGRHHQPFVALVLVWSSTIVFGSARILDDLVRNQHKQNVTPFNATKPFKEGSSSWCRLCKSIKPILVRPL